jgi:hypothetical protein
MKTGTQKLRRAIGQVVHTLAVEISFYGVVVLIGART